MANDTVQLHGISIGTAYTRDDGLWCVPVTLNVTTAKHKRPVVMHVLAVDRELAEMTAEAYRGNALPMVGGSKTPTLPPMPVSPTLDAIAGNDARQGRGG